MSTRSPQAETDALGTAAASLLLRRGLRLTYLTLAWNVVGTVVVAIAAVQARSVAACRFAAAAAIGLLGVTRLALARPLADVHPILLVGAVVVLGAERLGAHPVILIAAATLLGTASSLLY